MALISVAILVLAGIAMSIAYIDSLEAVYGTAYGLMVATKVALLSFLLLLGGMNYLAVRHFDIPIMRLRRFAEVEIGIGITALFVAASLTSLPPAADMTQDRVTMADIVDRMRPQWPRLDSPARMSLAIPSQEASLAASTDQLSAADVRQGFPPRNAQDIAWSEYNHHWAGILVLAIGILAVMERIRRLPRWLTNGAGHWPLLFLLLAGFLFLRSDPETWPLGDIGFWESLRDPEVLQHRASVALIVGFALFEWGVRTGRIPSSRAALVFPLVTAAGAGLLLTHSHALANVRDQLLIEMTHVPLALLGVLAAWARWLEQRLTLDERRLPSWVWRVCFILIGLLLLDYREA